MDLEALWKRVVCSGEPTEDFLLECGDHYTRFWAATDAIKLAPEGKAPLPSSLQLVMKLSFASKNRHQQKVSAPSSILSTLNSLLPVAAYALNLASSARGHVQQPGCAAVVLQASILVNALEGFLVECGRLDAKSTAPALDLERFFGTAAFSNIKNNLVAAAVAVAQTVARLGDLAGISNEDKNISVEELDAANKTLGAGLVTEVAAGTVASDEVFVQVLFEPAKYIDVLQTGRTIRVLFNLVPIEPAQPEQEDWAHFESDEEANNDTIKAIHAPVAMPSPMVATPVAAEKLEAATTQKKADKVNFAGGCGMGFAFKGAASACKKKVKACNGKLQSCFNAAKAAMLKPIR